MSRPRLILTFAAFLATFAWLLSPELKGSPAALWPSVLAVGLAFVTRDIYLALFAGAFSGAILIQNGNVFAAFLDLFARYLIPALKDPWNLSVLIFTLLMGGLVELLNRGGGMAALTGRFLRGSRDRRSTGLAVYGMGLLVFIDGLANAMLIGKSMRPITDRVGMSRAKLAFIVDSTSSPIAGLSLISTWVAYEMSVIKQGLENTGIPKLLNEVSPFQLLVQSLPFRYYNWFLLALVLLIIWLRRDFGPMRAAEATAAADHASKATTSSATNPAAPTASVWLALVPLILLVGGVFLGLFVQGGGLDRSLTLANVIAAFGRADAALVFVWVTAFASLVAMVLNRLGGTPEGRVRVVPAFFEGMQQMFLPMLILVFAWMLNGVIKELGAAQYLASMLEAYVPFFCLPALVFITAALVSFSTGTSWGTMTIVMPLVIPLAATLSGLVEGGPITPGFIAVIGAVLAGAVFGDHCSPISDTTIVSAFSSECDVMEHVRTQMPYALTAAGLAVIVGYLPAGFGIPAVLALAIGWMGCWLIVRYWGKE